MKDVTALIIVFVIVAVMVILPLIQYVIRKRDFKRQVQGKRPERELKHNSKISYDKKSSTPETDAIKSANLTNTRVNWRNSNF